MDASTIYGPRKTLYNRFVRWADKGIWQAIFHALVSAGGPPAQAIGRSHGGRTTKTHAQTDAFCRPIAFLLTGGQVADCTTAETLLDAMPKTSTLHGDKGYDINAIERMFCSLKDFSHIAATISYGLLSPASRFWTHKPASTGGLRRA